MGESSQGEGSRRSRDRFRKTMGCYYESSYHDRHGHQNAALDAMSQALRKAAQSPFSDEIECTEMPR